MEHGGGKRVRGFAEYVEYDGLGLAELVRAKQVTALEVLEAAIGRIEKLNPHLNAVVTKVYDEARGDAQELDLSAPFAGVPFLLKDLGAAQAGVPLSAGSRFFAHAPAPVDAEIVFRHKRAGLMILGRTNTPEFGLSATTEPVAFGPTLNPWNRARSSGGSSGGSAAAVAARMVPLAHASDGGGSIRIPASCCGLFGLKTTRNRNSFAPYAGEGLAGFSGEHVVSRSVRDSAAALDATAGPAPGDPYYPPPPARPFFEEVGAPPGRLRIAVTTKAFNGAPVHPDCVAAARAAAQLCEDLGHLIEEADPEYDVEGLDANFNRIFAVGAAANIALRTRALGKDPDPAGFERVTWAMVELGRQISAPDYVMMLNRLHAISREIARFFGTYDMLLSPTLAEPPVELGALDMMSEDLEAYTERLWRFTPFTYPFNVTGQPAMSVPLFWSEAGLPIGVHFAGRYGDEATLLRLAAQLEEARPWVERRPPEAA
jgi:Asp-tRNA(Asn)/Glu-tRNA(Gln) amidotransferase A subunit family amidase